MTDKQTNRIEKARDGAGELLRIMEVLRSPEGCPWDRKQTHESLKRYLAEECAEFMDAVDDNDAAGMREEMGDVLMNMFMQAVIASEQGTFELGDVFEEINAKMIRRHPHVFGDTEVKSADDVKVVWDKIKATENKPEKKSVLDGIPRNMSALLTAREIQRKAAKYGFDWSAQEQILDKIEEELHELREAYKNKEHEMRIDEEIGDLLFSVVNLSRFRNRITAEDLLMQTVRKFKHRFGFIEQQLAAQGKSLETATLDEMEALWQQAKSCN